MEANWEGWIDSDSGIIRYDFNIYSLSVLDHRTGLLEPMFMLKEYSVNYTEVRRSQLILNVYKYKVVTV